MSEHQTLDDRQHAAEFLKILDSWLPLRLAERTRLQVSLASRARVSGAQVWVPPT
jgi:hypothetical protein